MQRASSNKMLSAGTSIYATPDSWTNHTGKTDIPVGLGAYHVWSVLGWHDIKQRYRRSVLGPFWFTLSTFLMIGVLGFLYSTILHQDIHTYLPYLGVGLVVWQYISSCINEGATTFINSSGLIKQTRIPLTVYCARVIWRNFLIMLHSLPALILLLLILGNKLNLSFLFVIPALIILYLQGIWVAIVLSIVCTRYRDVVPIVVNMVQIAFFFTPIMWMKTVLQDRQWIAEYNPIYHLIEIIRGPILGYSVGWHSWIWSISSLLIGFALAQILMVAYRERISYWI